jgi:type II secretory pathway component PulM
MAADTGLDIHQMDTILSKNLSQVRVTPHPGHGLKLWVAAVRARRGMALSSDIISQGKTRNLYGQKYEEEEGPVPRSTEVGGKAFIRRRY